MTELTSTHKVPPTTAEQQHDARAYLIRTGHADLLEVLGLETGETGDGPRCCYCSAPTAGGRAKTCGGEECRTRLVADKKAAGRAHLKSTMGDTAYGVGR